MLNRNLRGVFWVLALMCVGALVSYQPARANHSTRVFDVTLCLNGARFKGASKADTSLYMPMTGRIFSVDNAIVGEGNTVTFEEIGTEYQFFVPYAIGTLQVGDSVLYSISDASTPYGLEGAAESGQIENCCIAPIDAESSLLPTLALRRTTTCAL